MRQTAAEIDHAILDVAARMFATYGYAHTSVQQIADAVGYSKPGLLHRFGSKETLHRAVLDEVTATVHAILLDTAEHSSDPDQLHHLLEQMTRRALRRPGMAQMMLRTFEADAREPGFEAVQALGHRLAEALDHPLSGPADRLRVLLAFKLIVTAASSQHSKVHPELHVDSEELVPLIVSLAGQVVGARAAASL